MQARAKAGVPLVIGTAGTCRVDDAVDWPLEITHEIADELGQSLKIAVVKYSQPSARVVEALQHGRIHPLPNAPEISEESLNACTNIVALAGVEQIGATLETGADIVIAGRTSDAGINAALPLMQGCHAGRMQAWGANTGCQTV